MAAPLLITSASPAPAKTVAPVASCSSAAAPQWSPPNRQREIAPVVRAIAARNGLPYHETPLLESMRLFAKAMTGLSIPLCER